MTNILLKIGQSLMNVDNHKVINLRSIQWARLVYLNQYGNERVHKPHDDAPTYRNRVISRTDFVLPTAGMPRETELERCQRLELIDEWLPVLYMKFAASGVIKFTGEKALSLYKAYCARQFSGKTKKSTKE